MTDQAKLIAGEQASTLATWDEARHIAQMRERAAITERMELGYAAAKGEARGEAIGLAKGIELGFQQALHKLIKNGIEESVARNLLGLAEK